MININNIPDIATLNKLNEIYAILDNSQFGYNNLLMSSSTLGRIKKVIVDCNLDIDRDFNFVVVIHYPYPDNVIVKRLNQDERQIIKLRW